MVNVLMLLAGLTNILGISLFSKLFTNKNLSEFDSLFDLRGNILILLWGLTYIFTTETYNNPIMLVFFVEKLVYVINYVYSFIKKSKKIKSFWKNDKLTFLFLNLYGIVDLVFAIIFLMLFFKKQNKNNDLF